MSSYFLYIQILGFNLKSQKINFGEYNMLQDYKSDAGTTVQIDISDEACEQFGFRHGQIINTVHGQGTVIGVAPLYVGSIEGMWISFGDRVAFCAEFKKV